MTCIIFLLERGEELFFLRGRCWAAGNDEAVAVTQDGLGLNGINDDFRVHRAAAPADNNGVLPLADCGGRY